MSDNSEDLSSVDSSVGDSDSDYNEELDHNEDDDNGSDSEDLSESSDTGVENSSGSDEGSEEEEEEEEDDEEKNALRQELFEKILRENVTYQSLRERHIRDLDRALHNKHGDKILEFAKTNYTNRYTETVLSDLQKRLQDELAKEAQTRTNRGGCSTFFSDTDYLGQIFSYVLCQNCVVPQAQDTLPEAHDTLIDAVFMVNDNASSLIASSIIKKVKAGPAGDPVDLILSRRAVGASAEVLRVLQEKTDIQIDCKPRKKRTAGWSKKARTGIKTYGCSMRAQPQEKDKMKVRLSYKQNNGIYAQLLAIVQKNTLLRDLLSDMKNQHEDIRTDFSTTDCTVYVREPYSFYCEGTRLIKVSNDLEVQKFKRSAILALKGDEENVFKPMLKINDQLAEELVVDIKADTKLNAVWGEILLKIGAYMTHIGADNRTEYKFTYLPCRTNLRSAIYDGKWTPRTKLAQLRKKFKVDFFSMHSRLQKQHTVSSRLNTRCIRVKIERM